MAYPNSIASFVTKIDKSASGYYVGPEYFNVPSTTPYEIYLDHVPKDSSSTAIGASGGATWTEVLVAPTSPAQYLVDYTTGKVTFYSANASAAVQATYRNLGDDIMATHVNSLQEEIIAIESELGENISGGSSNAVSRINDLEANVNSKMPNASGISGDWITDNTIRAGALMSDIKGSSWATVGRPVLTDIPAHTSLGTDAHASTAISAVGPGTTAFTNVSQHVQAVGNGAANPTNPHGLAFSDLSVSDIDIRPLGNLSSNVTYSYNVSCGGVSASGNILPTSSGYVAGPNDSQHSCVGTIGTPFASGNFDVLQASSFKTGGSSGVTGTFTTAGTFTIRVVNGLIVSIV